MHLQINIISKNLTNYLIRRWIPQRRYNAHDSKHETASDRHRFKRQFYLTNQVQVTPRIQSKNHTRKGQHAKDCKLKPY